MCFNQSQRPDQQAKAPAPPLEAPDPAEIGEARKQETRDAFGTDQPTYRVKRGASVPQVTPSDPIRL